MPYRPRQIESILQSKFGFEPSTADHRWLQLQLPGLEPIVTKTPHDRREIGRRLEGLIARQLRVRHKYFRGMMDCTNSRDAYREQVTTDPYPPFEKRF